MNIQNDGAAVTVGTYTETEVAIRLGVDRTTVRRIALTQPHHEIARACLRVTDHKRLYSRERIEAFVSGAVVSK